MTRSKPSNPWLLAIANAALLLMTVLLSGCGGAPVNHLQAAADFLTIQPEMALTLTAWPTAPPLITALPSATAAPQPLWTAEPEATAIEPSATPVPLSTAAPTEEGATVAAPEVAAAGVGSNPPPVQLLIPDLGLDVPVVEVSWDVVQENGTWRSVWQTADGAAGHHRNSANPGEAGNVVIAGHHNTRGEVFRDLSEIGQPGNALQQGSNIVLVAEDGRRYTYAVAAWDRFPVEDGIDSAGGDYERYLATGTRPIVTLITCWPYESNSHRVVVIAELEPSE